MNKKLLLGIACAAILSGCAGPRTLYDWGHYEQTLFTVYHDPATKAEALEEYLHFVSRGGIDERIIAPGLYAEAGTFMLQEGDLESAIEFYRLEYEAWPESRPMLSVLIENLEARL